MKWQPIETAPKGIPVKVIISDALTIIAQTVDGVFWRKCWDAELIETPTHWMPLPAHPKEGE